MKIAENYFENLSTEEFEQLLDKFGFEYTVAKKGKGGLLHKGDTKKERYLNLIDALGIKVGDKIKVKEWFTYEVREDGFYHNEDGWNRGYRDIFDLIVRRGFEKVNESEELI